MSHFNTVVRVTSVVPRMSYALVEDMADAGKIYNIEKQCDEMFESLRVGDVLSVLVSSDGSVVSVFGLQHPVYPKHPYYNQLT